MWYGGGHPCSHSMFVEANSTINTSRLAANASQIMNKNIITATKDTSDPIEETVFHNEYASG